MQVSSPHPSVVQYLCSTVGLRISFSGSLMVLNFQANDSTVTFTLGAALLV